VSKHNISATVDDDVYEFLQQDHINISGLVNQCLKQYMDTGGDVSAVRDLRIQQLMDEADEYNTLAEKKRKQAKELQEAYDKVEEQSEDKRREKIIEKAETIPADPNNPFVIDHAENLGLTPEELAREIAEEYDKEYNPFADTGLDSL